MTNLFHLLTLILLFIIATFGVEVMKATLARIGIEIDDLREAWIRLVLVIVFVLTAVLLNRVIEDTIETRKYSYEK